MSAHPTVQRDSDGTRRLLGRRFGEMRGTVVRCPDQRRAGRMLRPGDTHFPIECSHSGGNGPGVDTVHWLYLLPDLEGRTLVVECHADEVRYIERVRLTLTEIRLYLGVTDARAA